MTWLLAWQKQNILYNLEGSFCPNCKSYSYPARPICHHCHTQQPEKVFIDPCGTIMSFAKIHKNNLYWDFQTPYFIAIIQLSQGPIITTMLTDTLNPYIGQTVQGVIRKIISRENYKELVYGYKFRGVD
jgi:uncharacterized protein